MKTLRIEFKTKFLQSSISPKVTEMKETKFLLHGQFHRDNGWIMNDCLGYIKETKEEAIATCNRLNPNFVIHSVTIED